MGFSWSKVDDSSENNMSQTLGAKNTEESQVAPDSTTNDRSVFHEGEDVLLHDEDGLLYFGAVAKVCLSKEQCLIRFEDDHEKWAAFQSLRKIKAQEEIRTSCIVCKSTNSSQGNLILPCHYCRRGYHQNCHKPTLPNQFANEQTEWMCTRCVEKKETRCTKPKRRDSSLRNTNLKTACSVFPYNVSNLRWNGDHTKNEESIYCYCGKDGEWYRRMLQCNNCSQWFHDDCISILKSALLAGDRFFLFKCSVCNTGEEKISRLGEELTLSDIAHIALYNLTIESSKKYHDLDKSIIPFIEERWDYFKPSVDMPSSTELRNKLIVLTLPRFTCGGEFKKKKSLWGLRNCSPPPYPSILSTEALVTLKEWNCDHFDTNRFITKEKKLTKVKNSKKEQLVKKLPEDGQRTLRVRQQRIASEDRESVCDDSSDDKGKGFKRKRHSEDGIETSCDEIGTLDFFIPPPQNFDGSNNPFSNLNDQNHTTNYFVRPIKKRLSEKDIRITKNGEVKRKRFVKKLKRDCPISLFKSETNQRESITNYFGVAHKIFNGDKYAVHARRVLPDGQSQFLIQLEYIV